MKSFESRSRSATSTNKSSSHQQQSRQTSASLFKKTPLPRQQSGKRIRVEKNQTIFVFLDKGMIQLNEANELYKEIILRQHSVPLSDLMQINGS